MISFDPQSLIEAFGYGGVFLVSVISHATIIFPLPGLAAIVPAFLFLNPPLVALVGALGSAAGELVAYGAGRGGRALVELKEGEQKTKTQRWFERTSRWFQKYPRFALIVIFAATPLPNDVMGLFCGVTQYDVKKFFAAIFLGRLLFLLVLASGISLAFQP